MKKIHLIFSLGLSCVLAGCSSTYCDNSFPADMDAFVPDLRGRTFVYTNQESDTISLFEYDYFVQSDEVLEACSKCSCEGPRKVLFFKLSPVDNWSGRFDVICGSNNEKQFKKYWHMSITNLFFDGIQDGLYGEFVAEFDGQGHFTQRGFGDTIVLKSPSPRTDTALWVAGVGLARLNDFYLVSVTDSTGAVLYQAGAQQ